MGTNNNPPTQLQLSTPVDIKLELDLIMADFLKYGPKNPREVIKTKVFSPSEVRAYEKVHRHRWLKEVEDVLHHHGPFTCLMDFVTVLLSVRRCSEPICAAVYIIHKFKDFAVALAKLGINPFDLFQRYSGAFAYWVNVVLELEGMTRREGVAKVLQTLKDEGIL